MSSLGAHDCGGGTLAAGWVHGDKLAVRTTFGRPLPVLLIALEKLVGGMAAAIGAIFALAVHAVGSTDPLTLLIPGEVSETPREITMRWLDTQLVHLGPAMLVIGLGLAFWALLLGAEALGIWMDRAWGEFLIIIETGSFLPIELWHLITRPHPTAFITIGINLLVLWYVVGLYRRRLERRSGNL